MHALFLFVESRFLGEDQRVFIRTDRDEILFLELLDVVDQQLIRLLYKDDVCHAFIHALFELLELFLFI